MSPKKQKIRDLFFYTFFKLFNDSYFITVLVLIETFSSEKHIIASYPLIELKFTFAIFR